MKKIKAILSVLISAILILSLVACGGSQSTDNSGSSQTQTSNTGGQSSSSSGNTGSSSSQPIKITFWYSMGGKNMEILEGYIDEYNKMQDKVVVEGIYQGSYEEALNKLKTVAGTKEAPTLMQVYDGGTLFMKISDFIVPVQDFIDKENFDISIIEPAIRSYYTDYEGRLNSMPFNSSEPILYYNKDMFRNAGLDPEKPPLTIEEIAEYAEKLTVRKGNQTEVYGFTMMVHAWFIEQIMANCGALYVDNDNGRKDIPTKAVFDTDLGLKIFKWLYDMYRNGTATSYGRGWNQFRVAFQSGQVAMTFDSSANLAACIANSPFEVGTARMPTVNGIEPHGCPIGGASIYIIKGASEEQQQAAWEFMKYLVTPELQADWHINTGYFPVNIKSYDIQAVKDNLVKFPQFMAPIEQVRNTKIMPATQGVLTLNMEAVRDKVNTCIEGMFEGTLTPEKALEIAAAEVTKVLEKDKAMVGK